MGAAADPGPRCRPGKAARGLSVSLPQTGWRRRMRTWPHTTAGREGFARGKDSIVRPSAQIAGGPDDEGEAGIAAAAATRICSHPPRSSRQILAPRLKL